MQPPFHYEVRVKLTRYLSKDKIDFVNFSKVFQHQVPIRAREQAFEEYKCWIEDLYTGIGRAGEYTTDHQANIDLKKYLSPPPSKEITIGENSVDLDQMVDFGIGVYFVMDAPWGGGMEEDWSMDVGEASIIHGIGGSNTFFFISLEAGLYLEINYYNHYQADKGGYERWYTDGLESFDYLETPYDWQKMTPIITREPAPDSTEKASGTYLFEGKETPPLNFRIHRWSMIPRLLTFTPVLLKR
jgi:hypothetical protein